MPRRTLLAYAGQHHNGHTLTGADLAEVAETGNEIGEAPMTIGHVRGTGAPRYGRFTNFSTAHVTHPITGQSVTGLYADGDPLDAVKSVINDGFYSQRSIGLNRDPRGRLYPHHVALLGASPPAIKGLDDLRFSEGDVVMEVALVEPAAPEAPASGGPADFYDGAPLCRILSNEIDRLASTDAYAGDGAREAVISALAEAAEVSADTVQHVLDGDIPRPDLEWLRAFARALGVAEQTLVDAADFWYADPAPLPADPAPMPTPPSAPETAPTPEADFSDNPQFQALQQQVARANDRHKAGQLGRLRDALSGRLDGDAAERLVQFADRVIPAGADAIDFSDEGQDPREADPLEELIEIAGALPDRSHFADEFDFSDEASGESEAAEVRAKASRSF